MRKWTKPLFFIIIIIAIGGSCFWLGYRTGNQNGYMDGMAEQALLTARGHSWEKVILLKVLRGETKSKKYTAEGLVELSIESDILTITSFDDTVSNELGKILTEDVANYIKAHPFKAHNLDCQKRVDEFINKYGSK